LEYIAVEILDVAGEEKLGKRNQILVQSIRNGIEKDS